MSNDGLNIPKNETFTWLQPGAWRKPCIVHVPDHHHMVLQVQRTMPRSIKDFDACSRGKLLLLEPDEGAFVQPAVLLATKEALRRKAEERHLCYTDVPVDSKRYRFMALNEMGRLMVGADGICG